MKYLNTVIISLFTTIFIKSQQNIVIHTGYPTEPSIAINPINTNIMAAGSNITNYYYSTNGGYNWTRGNLTSTYGVWGDPALVFDYQNNLFFAHLSNPPSGSGSWTDRIVVQKSTNGGASYNNGSFAGLNGVKVQDKQWLAVDKNNNLYMSWTQFDSYGSANLSDKTSIMFSKSTDNGNTWSNALKINQIDGDCLDEDNTVEGAVPAIGPNNDIYISWVGPSGLVFDRSLDGGNTWLTNDILISTIPNGWDYTIPGLDRCNGLPVTACDVSNGPYNGTIYVNWSDQRNGTNNTDIFLSKSTDKGNTWSAPVKVNNDTSGKHQFLTWMAVDQSNGNLYFVFYDRRNFADNTTDVYMAKSSDGGQTFTNIKINTTSFTPNSQVFFGDYTNVDVKNGVIRPIWGDQLNGNNRILTAIVNDAMFLNTSEIKDHKDDAITFYPNPVQEVAYISYKLHTKSKVEINLYDKSGKLIKKIADEYKDYGKYIQKIEIDKLNLPKGAYVCVLKVNGKIVKSENFIK